MNGVEYLIGNERAGGRPMRPYSAQALACAADFSAALMKLAEARLYPDVAALAFWCRPAALRKLAAGCPEAGSRLGRGLCFHIAPGNVPVNFAFSWLFGLLSGCSNIVRLPSRRFAQADLVCGALRLTLEKHPEIAQRTAFVRYPARDAATADFSARADARMIWGGDGTIQALRAMKTAPRCVDLCFADRYSVCILDGGAVLAASDADIRRLAEGFYNDTYLMDQNACSSPQLILWARDSERARTRFWEAVRARAQARYTLQAAQCVDKYAQMCLDAAELEQLERVKRDGNLLYRAELSRPWGGTAPRRGQGGYFYECRLENEGQLIELATEKYQTVTCFGVDAASLRRFVVENGLRGFDRVVPVGKALDIGIFWDGFDLARCLSRFIEAAG